MGFSSYECNKCKKSILSHHAVDHYQGEIPFRYTESVWFPKKDMEPIIGYYDGYGNVTDDEGQETNVYAMMEHEPEQVYECMVYHEDCWHEAGKPTKWVPSRHAEDQGFFVGTRRYS